MKSRKTKRLLISIMAALMVLMVLLSTVVAYASETVPTNYIIDKTGIISKYNIDLIDTVGKELEKNGVKLITVVEKNMVNKNPNSEIRNQYYNWYGQLEDNVKLVVFGYYHEENVLVVFDDNQNYVSSGAILKTQGSLQRYKDKADLESGMYYAYSVVAEEIADELGFSLETTDTTPKYNTSNWFKSMPGIFGTLIVVVLAFSFRKRKK